MLLPTDDEIGKLGAERVVMLLDDDDDDDTKDMEEVAAEFLLKEDSIIEDETVLIDIVSAELCDDELTNAEPLESIGVLNRLPDELIQDDHGDLVAVVSV